jgi:hypothetical protein
MPDAQPRLDADLDTHAFYGDWERFLCRFGTIDPLPEPKSTMPLSTPPLSASTLITEFTSPTGCSKSMMARF